VQRRSGDYEGGIMKVELRCILRDEDEKGATKQPPQTNTKTKLDLL